LNTASTTLLPLINFGGSANKVIEISNCNLTYANILTDTGGNKCCILFSNSSGTYTVSISQCLLLCEGAITGTPQIQCIQDTGAGAVVMAYGGLLAGATAHHISPNVTKTQYVSVP
jgi:fructose-specific phosphotransferase system IIC component